MLRGVLLLGLAGVWPEAAAGRRDTPVSDPCGGESLHGFVFEVGNATGQTEAEALERARESARKLLYQRLCGTTSAYGSLRCDAVRRQIDPWRGAAARQGRKEYSACATAAIPVEYVDQLERELVQLQRDVDALAAQVIDRLDGSALAVAAPQWATGCSAGDVGASLAIAVRSALGQQSGVRVLPPEKSPEGDDRVLGMRLAPLASGISLAPSLAVPGQRGEEVLPGFSFPAELLQIADTRMDACAGDELLGTDGGVRFGQDSLSVEVHVPSRGGVLCPGERFEPFLRVDRPARVQVYSVSPGGEAHLVWPSASASDRVEGSLSLGTMAAVPEAGGGEERLVALAIPADQEWGSTLGWTGWCRVRDSFGSELYPPGAAVGASTFTVLAPGEADCLRVPTAPAQPVVPPTCGE